MSGTIPTDKSLYSFDLFDTLVYRPLKRPFHVFDLIEQSGVVHYRLPGLHWFGFRRWRVLAERIARVLSDREDISSTAIYRVLAWVVRDPARVFRRELALEAALLAPVPENVEVVKALLSEGRRCCIVTDMYLPVTFLRRLVRRSLGCDLDLFVSSAVGLTKKSGNLYRHIGKHYGIEMPEICHIGDNAHSDGAVPQALGIHEVVLPGRDVRDNSCSLFEYFTPYGGHHSTFEELGYAVVGPACAAFARFIANEAAREGVRKVFFCARDTYLIKEAFDRLAIDTESRYLRLSRRALYIPAYSRHGDPSYLFEGRISGRQFFERLGLEPPPDMEALDPSQHRRAFVAALREQGFDRRAEEEAEALLGYLRHEGLQGDVALVDLGWRGSLQDSVVALLGDGLRVRGLYFGLLTSGHDRKGFYFDNCRPAHRLAQLFQSLPVFEFLFTEPCHSLQRVRSVPDGFAFDYVHDEPEEQVHARNEIAKGCRRFLDDFAKVEPFTPTDLNWALKSLDRLLRRYLAEPTRDTLEAFQGIGHAEAFGGSMYGQITSAGRFTLAGYRNSFWRAAYVRTAGGLRGRIGRVLHALIYSRIGVLLVYKYRHMKV